MSAPAQGSELLGYSTLAYLHKEKGRGFGMFGAVCLWPDSVSFVRIKWSRPLGLYSRKVPARHRPVDPGDPRTIVRVLLADVDVIERRRKLGYDDRMIDQVFVTTRWGDRFCFAGFAKQAGVAMLLPALRGALETAGHQLTEVGEKLYVDRPPELLPEGPTPDDGRKRRIARMVAGGAAAVLAVMAMIGLMQDETADSRAERARPERAYAVGDCVEARGMSLSKISCKAGVERKISKVFHMMADSSDGRAEDVKSCQDHLPAWARTSTGYSFEVYEIRASDMLLCIAPLRP